MTKITYLTPLYFNESSCLGGGERYPLNLARGVVAAGRGRVEVDLVSFGDKPAMMMLEGGITLRVLTAAGRPNDSLDVVSWELPEAFESSELIHIHQPFTRCGEMGLLVARLLGKPVIVTDHGGHSSTLGREIGILELADEVVAYSKFGASFHKSSTPITVIPGGVDAERFQPSPTPVQRDRVLYVGRILPHKGIDQLIEALPPELPLTICGRPYHAPYYARLRQLAEGRPISFETEADDARIRELYARAWATVLPSVYHDCYGNVHQVPELMGFTLLESMACGTPAIANRVGAMPEFIEEGVSGFVYDDLETLGRRLRQLANDPALCDAMGSQARIQVLQRFDLRVAGEALLRVYRNRIQTSRGSEAAA